MKFLPHSGEERAEGSNRQEDKIDMLVFVYENEYYDKWGGVLGAGWNFVGGGRLCLSF